MAARANILQNLCFINNLSHLKSGTSVQFWQHKLTQSYEKYVTANGSNPLTRQPSWNQGPAAGPQEEPNRYKSGFCSSLGMELTSRGPGPMLVPEPSLKALSTLARQALEEDLRHFKVQEIPELQGGDSSPACPG